jgi:hypothetical protein
MQIVVLMVAPQWVLHPAAPATGSLVDELLPVTKEREAGELRLALATWTAVGVNPDRVPRRS